MALGNTLSSRPISIIAQGPTYCAVCALRTAEDYAVEQEVQRGIIGNSIWRVAKGPMLDGRPNPRCCPHDPARRHWLLLADKDQASSSVGQVGPSGAKGPGSSVSYKP